MKQGDATSWKVDRRRDKAMIEALQEVIKDADCGVKERTVLEANQLKLLVEAVKIIVKSPDEIGLEGSSPWGKEKTKLMRGSMEEVGVGPLSALVIYFNCNLEQKQAINDYLDFISREALKMRTLNGPFAMVCRRKMADLQGRGKPLIMVLIGKQMTAREPVASMKAMENVMTAAVPHPEGNDPRDGSFVVSTAMRSVGEAAESRAEEEGRGLDDAGKEAAKHRALMEVATTLKIPYMDMLGTSGSGMFRDLEERGGERLPGGI